MREAEAITRSGDAARLIDYGVEIRTVKQSSAGRSPGGEMPPVVECGTRMRVGGRFDTVTLQFVGPCENWRIWLVGEKQAQIIREFIDGTRPTRNALFYSAEGAGKTVLMAMLIWITVIMATMAGIPGALGATAPTSDRLGSLTTAICDLAPVDGAKDRNPHAWATLFADARELRSVGGQIIQLRSTKRQSGATGSPVQGYTWNLGAFMDEAQDQVEQGAYPDIVMRLRGGKAPPIIGTATAKDSPTWRDWRDALSDNWRIDRLLYSDTPFVHAEHWVMAKQECTAREWQRRGLAMDVGPERMTYNTWDRATNINVRPDIGCEDVTREVLARWGPNLSVLIGHDPGKLCDVSILLRAYRYSGQSRHVWRIVDEVSTDNTTTEGHVKVLLRRLREKWHCNELDWRGNPAEHGNRAFVRADPYSDSGRDENSPDRSVYTTFRNAGLQILPAAIGADAHKVKIARVPKEARIEMVTRLLCDANGTARLFIDQNGDRSNVAAKTVASFELSERDGDGRAEMQRKDRKDLSHWTAAVGYALWALERPRFASPYEQAGDA